ncbi:major facilitator superfamily domain-containing protein [Circinella umbellata]|nr:major facilitator superfamily domain-containing protein [Circinella umbellata]
MNDSDGNNSTCTSLPIKKNVPNNNNDNEQSIEKGDIVEEFIEEERPISIKQEGKDEFNSTASIVNISVAGHTAVYAFFPTISGVLADIWGRRLVVLIALLITMVSCIGIALSSNVYVLIIMRMFEAVGGGTLKIAGRGIISDISLPATRAKYTAYSFIGAQVSMVTGPAIGGLIAQQLSWRWIFWILICITGLVFIITIIYLPETIDTLIGGYYNLSLLQYIQKQKSNNNDNHDMGGNNTKQLWMKKTVSDFKTPYRYFMFPDFVLIMLISGIHFGLIICYMVHLSYLFQDYYQMNVQNVGLCFLVLGIGDIIGAICGAHYQDFVFHKVIKAYSSKMNEAVVFDTNKSLPIDFPIYKARLFYIWPCSIVIQLGTLVFGWLFIMKTHLAIPLIILFFLSFTMAIVDDATLCLTQDLQPDKVGAISGSLNLVQGIFGGIVTVIVEPLSSSIGVGWTYTLLGSVLMTTNIMLLVLLRNGVAWRIQREEKDPS